MRTKNPLQHKLLMHQHGTALADRMKTSNENATSTAPLQPQASSHAPQNTAHNDSDMLDAAATRLDTSTHESGTVYRTSTKFYISVCSNHPGLVGTCFGAVGTGTMFSVVQYIVLLQ